MADDKEKFIPPDEATEIVSPSDQREALAEEGEAPEEEIQEEEAPKREEEPEEESEESFTRPLARGLIPASLRDRAAAAFLDILTLGYLYWVILFCYHYIVYKELFRPLPTHGKHGIAFHSIYLVLCFLYFFVAEGVFFTTLGKFFCRLSVRNSMGRPPSLFAVALRNLLRPLDYALLLLPTWILMEKTRNRLRLGDLAASTVVVKHLGNPPQLSPVEGKTASASARIFMGIVDLALLAGWLAGWALWIDPKRPELSTVIVLLSPLLYLLWNLVWEGGFQNTVGQWIFGCKLVREDGTRIGFPEALLRSIFAPLDPTFFLSLFLSSKNRTGADHISGTAVVHVKRSWSFLMVLSVALLVVGAVWFAGFSNARSFLVRRSLDVRFLVKVFSVEVGGRTKDSEQKGLLIERFSYLEQDRATPRHSAEFKPGETIFFSFDISGFAIRDKEAWMQEDLTVRYPNNTIGFRQENIVDFHQLLKNPEMPLEIVNTLSLPPTAQPGHYTLVIVLHDRFGDTHLTEQRTFRIVPVEGVSAPAEGSAAPSPTPAPAPTLAPAPAPAPAEPAAPAPPP